MKMYNEQQIKPDINYNCGPKSRDQVNLLIK